MNFKITKKELSNLISLVDTCESAFEEDEHTRAEIKSIDKMLKNNKYRRSKEYIVQKKSIIENTTPNHYQNEE